MSLLITVKDLQTGHEESREVADGDYCLITASPCYLDGVQFYATGTAVLTVRGRTHRILGPVVPA